MRAHCTNTQTNLIRTHTHTHTHTRAHALGPGRRTRYMRERLNADELARFMLRAAGHAPAVHAGLKVIRGTQRGTHGYYGGAVGVLKAGTRHAQS